MADAQILDWLEANAMFIELDGCVWSKAESAITARQFVEAMAAEQQAKEMTKYPAP